MAIEIEDKRFAEWDLWCQDNLTRWDEMGIRVERIYGSLYALQRHIEFASAYALAHVALYESNGLYWVDYEALSLYDKPDFYRMNRTYLDISTIRQEILEFEMYMQGMEGRSN